MTGFGGTRVFTFSMYKQAQTFMDRVVLRLLIATKGTLSGALQTVTLQLR